MSLVQCGRTIHVRQRARRAWLFPVVSVMIFAFAVLSKRWVLPIAGWALVAGRLHRAARVEPVRVAMDRVEQGARALVFARVRAVRVSGTRVIVESADGSLSFDASLVGAREVLVRHLRARMLLARLDRRPKAERVALEALYVFDAEAVRVYKRRAVEILRGDGPWVAAGKERVYVRRRVLASAYRANARPDAIEVGALES
jgi:hypothetical protein